MGIGHFAVGLASKAAAPNASLGALLGAAMLPDLIWPLMLLAGWERVRIAPGDTAFSPLSFDHYPWSHSLLMALVWAVLAAIAYGLFARYATGAVFVGIGVISHWVLDWVSHRPDLPLWPGASPVVGLSLWNSVPATVVVETAMFVSSLWVYLRVTRARDRRVGTGSGRSRPSRSPSMRRARAAPRRQVSRRSRPSPSRHGSSRSGHGGSTATAPCGSG